MQIVAGSTQLTRTDRLAVARSALSGVLLVLVGVLVGWLCLGTPLVTAFVPHGRPSVAETATGVAAWGFAIVVPAAFLIIGVARIAAIIDTASSMRPRTATSRLAKALGPEYVAATGLIIPGGRRLHELVLGPFGLLVIAVVPPPHITRHVGSRWEIRDERGRWIPIEAPLDRATRDAERIRGWLASDDRDFVVRVYAAIVTADRPWSGRRPAPSWRPPISPNGSPTCRPSAASTTSGASDSRRSSRPPQGPTDPPPKRQRGW